MEDTGRVGSVARFEARVASDESFVLGEGPLWDAPRSRLLWVDVEAGTVHAGRLTRDRVALEETHRIDATVGAVVAATDGRLLVAGERAFHLVAPDGSVRSGRALLPPGTRRWNDGGCDPAGRFLVGSLDRAGAEGGESLVELEPDGSLTTIDADLTLSNGLDWSPDGRRFLSVDSVPGVVHVRDRDPASGELGPRREWRRFEPERDGVPDGLTIDAAGCVWIAFWGAGEVRRFDPDGRLLAVVAVPAPLTTSCAFAGERLNRLVVTTARTGLAPGALAAAPDSGRLFLVDLGGSRIAGRPPTPWNGRYSPR